MLVLLNNFYIIFFFSVAFKAVYVFINKIITLLFREQTTQGLKSGNDFLGVTNIVIK